MNRMMRGTALAAMLLALAGGVRAQEAPHFERQAF